MAGTTDEWSKRKEEKRKKEKEKSEGPWVPSQIHHTLCAVLVWEE